MIITGIAFLPPLFSLLKFNHLCVHLSFQPTSPRPYPGGSKDAGEAQPAREQKHVCTVRAECTVGAAGRRQRSDRRHPDQVRKVPVSLHPVKQNRTDRYREEVRHNKTKQTDTLSKHLV